MSCRLYERHRAECSMPSVCACECHQASADRHEPTSQYEELVTENYGQVD